MMERISFDTLLGILMLPLSAVTGVVWKSYGKLKAQVEEHKTNLAVIHVDLEHIKSAQSQQGELLGKIYDNQLTHLAEHSYGKSSHQARRPTEAD